MSTDEHQETSLSAIEKTGERTGTELPQTAEAAELNDAETTADSSQALQPSDPARPTTATPELPIEIIAMITEALLEEGNEVANRKALITLSKVSRMFRAGTATVLFREIDGHKVRLKIDKLFLRPLEHLAHVKVLKLDLQGSRTSLAMQLKLFERLGPKLRKLSLTFHSWVIDELVELFNRVLSDKLETLDLIYATGQHSPSRLVLPPSIKYVSIQFCIDGFGSLPVSNCVEEQVWKAIEGLPKLEDWSVALESPWGYTRPISLANFPKTKAHLLSKITGAPAYVFHVLQQGIPGLSPSAIHFQQDDPFGFVIESWQFLAQTPFLTSLTFEKPSLDAAFLRNLPPNLEELNLIQTDVAGFSIRLPLGIAIRERLVDALSTLSKFRILRFHKFYDDHWVTRYPVTTSPAEMEGHLQTEIAFWKSLQAPFKIVVEDH